MRSRLSRLPTLVLLASVSLAAGVLPADARVQSTSQHLATGSIAGPKEPPTWRELSPPRSPTPTAGMAMAYDSARRRMVAFGGGTDTGLSNQTWTWDGSTWQRLHPPVSPPGRGTKAFAYDPVRDEVVMYGGSDGFTGMSDTWVFAGGVWTQKHPKVSPPALSGAVMAFDTNLQQLVLFGGDAPDPAWNGTMTWDGENWARLDPAQSPPGRTSFDMANDPARNALVIFGGRTSSTGVTLTDTWSWDGSTWTEETLTKSPDARINHSMATFGRRVALFGGVLNSYHNSLWVLRDMKWRERTPAISPSPRAGAALEWDRARREVVLFGGEGCCPPATYSDTWALTRRR